MSAFTCNKSAAAALQRTCVLFLLFLLCVPPAAHAVHAPEGWTILFQDTFETGNAGSWDLKTGWTVEMEGANHVLSGAEQSWATITSEDEWTDYSFQSKIKCIRGAVHINIRKSESGRYFVAFSEDGLRLLKEYPWGTIKELMSAGAANSANAWHTVELVTQEGNLKVYVNDELRIDYADSSPLYFGRAAYENPGNSAQVRVDDVVITGKALPPPPQGYTWKRMGGPSGGLGYDVRIHPNDKNTMYVTDNPSGVNKSTDGGTTWAPKNAGIKTRSGPSLDGIPVFALTIDPVNPDIVWAGTQNAKGIYKSIDGGETWLKKDFGVAEGDEISFRNFGIHPQDSSIVFAGGEITTPLNGKIFNKTKGKIYKTEDGGENWRSVWEGDDLVRFILFDYTNPDIMYASTGIFDREAYDDKGTGILKSTDSGETWFAINNGISNMYLGFLEMHPTNSRILFAAAGNNTYWMPPYNVPGAIYRTKNGGDSWEEVLSGEVLTVVTFSRSNPDIIYAGGSMAFYRSEDGGSTWKKLQKSGDLSWGPPGIRPGFPISAVVDPDDPYTVFVNNYGGGNFKTTDGGETWINSSSGYSGAHLHCIAIDKNNPATVYTIGRSGPFRSYNGGADWQGLAYGTSHLGGEWDSVAINPANPQEVIITDEFAATIQRSTDGGSSWTQVFQHPQVDPAAAATGQGFKALAFAPSNPGIIYAGLRRGRNFIDGNSFQPAPGFGMFKSTDGGKSWSEINNGLHTSLLNINCLAIHPSNPDIVYIGTWKDGVFKTTDGGKSWMLKSNGLAASDVRSLAIDQHQPDTVYAGLGEGAGVFKTTDGGGQWGAINAGLNLVCPSYLLPAGKTAKGWSFDRPAKPFIKADYYAVPWTSVWSIAIDPVNPQKLYAADHSSGVYLSTDGGANWARINDGLSTRAVTSLAISADGKVLYAATEGGGVYRIGAVSAASTTTTTGPATTTSTAPGGICPAEMVLGENPANLALLHGLRDTVLARTVTGKGCVASYYKYAPEISALFARHPALKARAQKLLIKLMPAVRDAIQTGKIQLGQETLSEIESITTECFRYAGPELRRELTRFREDIRSSELFRKIGAGG